jgi:hypothetical protein
MTTAREAREAERVAAAQRFYLLSLLQVAAHASATELDIFRKMKAAKTAEDLDKMLAHKTVLAMFGRRVLFYGDATP